LGFSAIDAGLTMLPFSVGAFLGTGVAVPLGTKIGKPIMFTGALIQAGGALWTMAVVRSHGAELDGWDLLWPLGVMGVGLALLVIPLLDVALARVPVDQAGAASGAYGTFQQIGAALGVAIAGVVFFGAAGEHIDPTSLRTAFEAACWVAVAGYAMAAAAALLLPSRTDVLAHAHAQLVDQS